jgi:uncharacterized protein (TIGR02117 family)
VARRRRSRRRSLVSRALSAILAIPLLYLLAALAGSLIPVNSGWTEPAQGTTIYLADNGIHTDIIMPVAAEGLDWSRFLGAGAAPTAWIAFGAGEEHVYLNTPTWWDITPHTLSAALAGGPRVMHVEYVATALYADRQIRLRPEEYRRLWSAIRAQFALDASGRPLRIAHPGYGDLDAFYRGTGRASMVRTCNTWVADQLRLAGVKASIWPHFSEGLLWRYRRVSPMPPLRARSG